MKSSIDTRHYYKDYRFQRTFFLGGSIDDVKPPSYNSTSQARSSYSWVA